ncbi:MAG: hypothetical protein WCG47_31355 [Dermatophilaceae bacterium]
MTNHAVLAVWTLDNTNFDPIERDKVLITDVVPRVSTLPGFVEGRWNRSSDGVRAYNTVAFDDRAAAEEFVRYVRGDASAAAAAGVHLHSLEILDVIGSA